MKIAAGIIVFNSDFVLKQVLQTIYPHFDQILVAQGPVKFWQDQGFTQSTDKTVEILNTFPDPEGKITIVHGMYPEKTAQANAYMEHLRPDMDYIWNIDADELFMDQDIIRVKELLWEGQYTSAGFRSRTFFGGFDHYLTGFEENHEFLRVRKVYPGSQWKDHRPPTIEHPPGTNSWPEKHLSFETLASQGIFMYHYSYVFPRQVMEKVRYYETAVINQGNCIPVYFKKVWLPWAKDIDLRTTIERKYRGVHEFVPEYRGDCYTARFNGSHPPAIAQSMKDLIQEWHDQMVWACVGPVSG